MNINPGDFNRKIKIVKLPDSRDSEGYPNQNDVTVLETWAKFSRMSGTEIYKAGTDFSNVKARFLIRHTSTAINTKMKILYAGQLYGIQYINDYGDNKEYTEIIAEYLETAGVIQ